MGRSLLTATVLVLLAGLGRADEPAPLSPIEARKKVGDTITVEMKVATAKDRLEKRGEIYLDAELDFRDEKNFAVVVTKTGAAKLKDAGIADPAEHFRDKTIRATGVVKVVDDVPRIEIDEAKQIAVKSNEQAADKTVPISDRNLALLEYLDKLGGKSHLEGDAIVRVHLGGTKADDAALAKLGSLTELVELSLAKSAITDAGLPSLAGLKKLKALHLADNPITDKGVAAVAGLTQLELLGLKGTQVSDAGLASLIGMTKLQWLGLRNTKVTDAGLVHLAKLKQLPGVSLSYCRITNVGLSQLAVLTHMERLILDHTPTTNDSLIHLKNMKNLHTLDLGFTSVGDDGLEHLRSLKKLRMLELNGTPITDLGLAKLAQLGFLKEPSDDKAAPIVAGAAAPAGLPPLPGLGLGATEVTDVGLVHLKSLLGIQRLDLSHTAITDAGLAHLHSLRHLRAVDLRMTKTTPAGAAALRKAIPEIRIFDK